LTAIRGISDDLLAPDAVTDPQRYYGRIREAEPAYWNARHRSWLLTRFDDVEAGFRDPRLSANRVVPHFKEQSAITDTVTVLARWMVFNDPPEHTRLRRLAQSAINPRVMNAMGQRIQVIVDDLLDRVEDAGSMDAIASLAFPLPAIVIAELLGVPPGDREEFKRWSDDLLALVFGAIDDSDRFGRAEKGLRSLVDYFGRLVARYRAEPADNVISRLIAAEVNGERLGEEDLVSTCVLLLFAGHETTTNLIGNGLLALLRNRDQLERLQGDEELIDQAVEEFLRYDGPAKVAVRWVAEDLEVGGRAITRGQRVLLVQTAANRDPRHFPSPDSLDLGRVPNDHLGFGFGIHYCLGAPLARMEGRAAIATVLRRLPQLALAPGAQLEWDRNLLGRSLKELPVVF